jgi:hypothetical protein
MASLVLSGDTSGSVTLAAPAVAGSTTQTLVNVTGTLAPLVSGTSQASTSGTSIDFTGIPSWVKRITVMFSGVSTNGTSNIQIQIGSGSVTTSGYVGATSFVSSGGTGGANFSAGFLISNSVAAGHNYNGIATLCLLSSNTWAFSNTTSRGDFATAYFGSGVSSALSGALDRVRITTVNGTDTFDAGTINILYE